MKIEINLSVPLHIKLFLENKFGEEYNTSKKDWFGMQIIALLEKKTMSNYSFISKREKEGSFFYKIKISISQSDKYGIVLTPDKEYTLIKFIESLFRDACFEFALINKELYGIDYKSSIINFLNYYNIDENKGGYIDALVRDFNRKKKKKICP